MIDPLMLARRRYYGVIVLAAVALTVVDFIAYSVLWSLVTAYAEGQGRGMRGGIGGSLMIYFGLWSWAFASVIAAIIAGSVRDPLQRWVGIFICLIPWFWFNYPPVSSYPIRLPVFMALGVGFIAGNGLLMPLLAIFARRATLPSPLESAPESSP